MDCSEILPADMRSMLRLAYELEERRPFPHQLTTLLVGLCELTNSHAAIAVEVRYLPRLQRVSYPLLEVRRNSANGRPCRSSLAGASSISSFRLLPLERASRAETGFGGPPWGGICLPESYADGLPMIHALQQTNDSSTAVGVVLIRRRAEQAFSERDEMLLDTTWRSHRFCTREPVRSKRRLVVHLGLQSRSRLSRSMPAG